MVSNTKVIAYIIAFAFVATYDIEIQDVPTLTEENIKAAMETCIDANDIDPNLVYNATKGNVPDDAELKETLFCYYELIGILVDNDINKEKLKEYFLMGKLVNTLSGIPVYFEDPAEKSAVIAHANEMVEKCYQHKSNAEETAFELFKCDENKRILTAKIIYSKPQVFSGPAHHEIVYD